MGDHFAPTREEIARRVTRVARAAQAEGLDALVILEPANIYYLSGFRTTLYTRFMAVALRTEAPRDALLIATSVDRQLALDPVWYPSLLPRTEVYYLGAPADGPLISAPGPLLDTAVRDGDRVGVDLAGASFGHVELLRQRYPNMALVDATPLLHAARSVKSALELAALRAANQVAVEALSRVPEWLRVGLSERELGAKLDDAVRDAGADGAGYPTLIGFGPKSLAPHAPPTDRQLRRDEMVTIAFGPTVAGYCADVVRAWYFGAAPAMAVEQARICTEVQSAALATIRAGARAGDAMVAAREAILRYEPNAPNAGSAGHSLGLTIHETPTLVAGNDLLLEEDMVLGVEPRQPGSAMPAIGLFRQCDVVRVTATGYELLTPMARGLVGVAP